MKRKSQNKQFRKQEEVEKPADPGKERMELILPGSRPPELQRKKSAIKPKTDSKACAKRANEAGLGKPASWPK